MMKPISRSKSDRPPDRKLSSLIKSKPPGASSSRPPVLRGHSPDLKRPSVHLKKGPHPSRSHASSRRSTSPYSSPRGSSSPIDSSKYSKKRKQYSNSPPPGRSSGPPRKNMTPPPPPHSRMSRNGSRRPSPGYDIARKKIRRELPPRMSMQRLPDKNIHPESRIPHRVIESPRDYAHDRPRDYSPRPTTSRPIYTSAGPSRDGFNINERSQPRRIIDPPYEKRERDNYISVREKNHGQTLDERFRVFGDDTRRSDHRIQFSRADLQNITIDVKRGMRDSSPTVRKILNPSDVKIVRHSSEGRRPIFDREEIKHCSRDLREDPYNERKLAGGTHFGLNYGELENFEITRHKFDNSSYQSPHVREGSTLLSERWRRIETHRTNSPTDRNERSRQYVRRSRSPEPYPERNYSHRSHSEDRDYRGEKYASSNDRHIRPLEYVDSRRPLPNDPSDLRHSLAVKKKDSALQRQKIVERRSHDHPSSHEDYRHNYPPPSRRIPMESSPEKLRDKRSLSPRRVDYSKPRRESPYSHERSYDRGRPRHFKPPEYSRRSMDPPPKSQNYYEHDKRELPPSYRGSRGIRSFRGRSLRGRSIRGFVRGGISRGRGMYRPSTTFRGRSSYPPRRGRRSSPHQWEHDMFDKAKQDH